ncbi:MAG: phosphoheptose isomerase [Nitrososphaerales archaeon]
MKRAYSRHRAGASASTRDSNLLGDGKKNFILGLDGCVCVVKGAPSKLSASAVLRAREVRGAKEWVNGKFDEGHLICFFTSRPERFRGATELWLRSHGFKYHSLVLERPVARIYHYIDDRHVQATTFRGRYTPLVRKEHRIQVFR